MVICIKATVFLVVVHLRAYVWRIYIEYGLRTIICRNKAFKIPILYYYVLQPISVLWQAGNKVIRSCRSSCE